MMLTAVALASDDVAASSARLAKIARLADLLHEAEPAEVPILVAWLSGELTQRQIGVGWAALREVPPPAEVPTLTVAAVEERFEAIGSCAGRGVVQRAALGLVGLRSRLESLGGNLTIESEVGVGTRLKACLPVYAQGEWA